MVIQFGFENNNAIAHTIIGLHRVSEKKPLFYINFDKYRPNSVITVAVTDELRTKTVYYHSLNLFLH